jgi:hypothetical protein
MRYELKPTEMEDGSTFYAVQLVDRQPPRFVGWIRPAMDGWTLVGYEDDDPRPYYGSQDEAVNGLIERTPEEQDAGNGL